MTWLRGLMSKDYFLFFRKFEEGVNFREDRDKALDAFLSLSESPESLFSEAVLGETIESLNDDHSPQARVYSKYYESFLNVLKLFLEYNPAAFTRDNLALLLSKIADNAFNPKQHEIMLRGLNYFVQANRKAFDEENFTSIIRIVREGMYGNEEEEAQYLIRGDWISAPIEAVKYFIRANPAYASESNYEFFVEDVLRFIGELESTPHNNIDSMIIVFPREVIRLANYFIEANPELRGADRLGTILEYPLFSSDELFDFFTEYARLDPESLTSDNFSLLLDTIVSEHEDESVYVFWLEAIKVFGDVDSSLFTSDKLDILLEPFKRKGNVPLAYVRFLRQALSVFRDNNVSSLTEEGFLAFIHGFRNIERTKINDHKTLVQEVFEGMLAFSLPGDYKREEILEDKKKKEEEEEQVLVEQVNEVVGLLREIAKLFIASDPDALSSGVLEALLSALGSNRAYAESVADGIEHMLSLDPSLASSSSLAQLLLYLDEDKIESGRDGGLLSLSASLRQELTRLFSDEKAYDEEFAYIIFKKILPAFAEVDLKRLEMLGVGDATLTDLALGEGNWSSIQAKIETAKAEGKSGLLAMYMQGVIPFSKVNPRLVLDYANSLFGVEEVDSEETKLLVHATHLQAAPFLIEAEPAYAENESLFNLAIENMGLDREESIGDAIKSSLVTLQAIARVHPDPAWFSDEKLRKVLGYFRELNVELDALTELVDLFAEVNPSAFTPGNLAYIQGRLEEIVELQDLDARSWPQVAAYIKSLAHFIKIAEFSTEENTIFLISNYFQHHKHEVRDLVSLILKEDGTVASSFLLKKIIKEEVRSDEVGDAMLLHMVADILEANKDLVLDGSSSVSIFLGVFFHRWTKLSGAYGLSASGAELGAWGAKMPDRIPGLGFSEIELKGLERLAKHSPDIASINRFYQMVVDALNQYDEDVKNNLEEVFFKEVIKKINFVSLGLAGANNFDPAIMPRGKIAELFDPMISLMERLSPQVALASPEIFFDSLDIREESPLGQLSPAARELFYTQIRNGWSVDAVEGPLNVIELGELGGADTKFSSIMQETFSSFVAPARIERPLGLPERMEIKSRQEIPIVRKTNSNEAFLRETLFQGNPDQLYGRTLEFRRGDKAHHFKFLREGEDPSLLAYELDMMNFLAAKKDEWGLLGSYPKGKYSLARVRASHLPEGMLSTLLGKGGPLELDQREGYYTFIAYEVDLDEQGRNNFSTYLNDPDLSHEEFLEALRINVHDRFLLAQKGLYDPEIIELYHNAGGGG